MTNKKLADYSAIELLEEIKKRELFTNSETNSTVLEKCKKNNELPKVILTYGEKKDGVKKCSRCNKQCSLDQFPLYHARVDRQGYLLRGNAVCFACAKISNDEKTKAVQTAKKNGIDVKRPNKGDTCPSCKNSWDGNWHADHIGDTFNGYICQTCNTGKHDHRGEAIKLRKENILEEAKCDT